MAKSNKQAIEWPKFVKETKEDILAVLKDIKRALSDRNSKDLVDCSNHVIHTASIHNESRAIYVSIIAYALGKLVEKEETLSAHEQEWEEFLEGIGANIDAAIKFLDKDEISKFDDALKNIMKLISEFDASFSKYVQEVLQFSKIQKGAKVYEHGLSLASVAKMIGVSQWELMEKVGETTVHEQKVLTAKSPSERYEQVKRIMKKRD